jgi:hypothetical protein
MILFAMVLVFLLVAFPTTSVGRALRTHLVDAPAKRLNKITHGGVAFFAVLAAVGVIMFVLFEAEGLRFFSYMAPDIIGWFTVFDISVYFDVILLSLALSATARVRDMVTTAVERVRLFRSSFVRRVTGREGESRSWKPTDKDSADPDPWGFAFA